MIEVVRASLAAKYDARLVDELLAAYTDAKENYYLGGLRLAEVEGGRFAEAAFRLLQEETTGTFDPLGKQLDTEGLIKTLANLGAKDFPDSIRLHIPRALRVVYDVRSKRDAAHLADGIDPNVQDATLVVSMLDWILAEFLRLHHNVSADEAQKIVEDLVTRKVPVIQDFDGFLKLLKPGLGAAHQVLALLYHRGARGAEYGELEKWIHPRSRHNLGRTLKQLVDDRSEAHYSGTRYFITQEGQRVVESRRIIQPAH